MSLEVNASSIKFLDCVTIYFMLQSDYEKLYISKVDRTTRN